MQAIPALLTTAEAPAFVEQREIGRYGGYGRYAGDIRKEILNYKILNYTNDIETDHDDALANIDAWLDQIRQRIKCWRAAN